MKILIVEDQENLAKLIKKGLESEGYLAEYVIDGETAQTKIELHHEDYDLAILDVMLPGKSGLEVCKQIRKKGISIPVLMLTARDGSKDIIFGLDAGADDYLTKPFSFEILLARIRALLRRRETQYAEVIEKNGIKIDLDGKKAYKKNQPLKLTLKEFNLLQYLMHNADKALSREQILSNISDFSYDGFGNVVDVHITNLRKKMEDNEGKIIETVRGVGYKFNSQQA